MFAISCVLGCYRCVCVCEVRSAPPFPQGCHLDESEWERAPLPLGCLGAPYEVWCSTQGRAGSGPRSASRDLQCARRAPHSALPLASVYPWLRTPPRPAFLSPRSSAGEAAPLHWLPPPLAWAAPHRLVALAGLELEQKEGLFPAHAQGSPYPSNALVVATLCRVDADGSGADTNGSGAGRSLWCESG